MRVEILLLLPFAAYSAYSFVQPSPFAFPNPDGLSWFQDAKFGLFMHWGPISQWGTEISFPLLCDSLPCTVQAANHTTIQINTTEELKLHRQAYADLAKTFNPVNFDPDELASIAVEAGFKYLVFTAEHCDGFANFKTNISSYNIMNTPYGKDVFRMLEKAFRAKGLKVGAYFCPSTWSSDDYWAPDALTALGPSCLPNYQPPEDPERWQRYLKYIHGQLTEIAVLYKPDLVWIDCFDYPNTVDTEVEQLGKVFQAQNPNVVMQVRTSGVWEDYLSVPDNYIYEANAIMGLPMMSAGFRYEIPHILGNTSWAYDPTATYKTPGTIIGNLLLIAAKGGNYLINLGLNSLGKWPEQGVEVFKEIGSWMSINGEALYGTVTTWPHQFTSRTVHIPQQTYYVLGSKNGSILYSILLHNATNVSANTGLPMHRHLVLDHEAPPTSNFMVNMAFVRKANLRASLQSVELLGLGQTDFFFNASGLWCTFQLPLEMAALGSYWSNGYDDMAPCATRGCNIYTDVDYILRRTEGFCYGALSNPGGLLPLYLIYNEDITDNTLVANPSNFSGAGYRILRTECYGYASPGEGLIPLDLYWNGNLKDYWALASVQSKEEAVQNGYTFVSTQGYIPALTVPVRPATLKYAYVFKLTFKN